VSLVLVDSLQQDLKTENPPGIELPLKSGRSRRLRARSRLTRE